MSFVQLKGTNRRKKLFEISTELDKLNEKYKEAREIMRVKGNEIKDLRRKRKNENISKELEKKYDDKIEENMPKVIAAEKILKKTLKRRATLEEEYEKVYGTLSSDEEDEEEA